MGNYWILVYYVADNDACSNKIEAGLLQRIGKNYAAVIEVEADLIK